MIWFVDEAGFGGGVAEVEEFAHGRRGERRAKCEDGGAGEVGDAPARAFNKEIEVLARLRAFYQACERIVAPCDAAARIMDDAVAGIVRRRAGPD